MIKNKFCFVINDYFLAAITIIFAYQINNYFGFIGINSADSFQTFDSGHRVLNGDLPFKDYWSTEGPLLDIFQAFFFKILEPNWFSYVIHASILNSIFAFFVYLYSRVNKIPKNLSLFFGVLSGLIMYPAAGTPQVDHHAIIIGTISLIFFFTFLKKKNFKILIIFPTIFLACFFIKQVPTAYYIIFISLIALIYSITLKENEVMINLLMGSFIAGILFFLIIKSNNIYFADIYDQYFALILGNFSFRIDNHTGGSYLDNILKIKYIILLIIPIIFVIYQKLKKYNLKKEKNYYLDAYLFISLIISSVLHESYTNNQSVTFGLIPIYSILIFLLVKDNKSINLFYIFGLLTIIGALRLINANEIYLFLIILLLFLYLFKLKTHLIAKKISYLILIYTLLISLLYFENIIRNRYWFDIISPNWTKSIKAQEIDSKLRGLVWLSDNQNTEKEISDIKYTLSYLKTLDENYIIITSYQIYNTILNKKNYSPVKYWWHNWTYPAEGRKYKSKFDIFFKKKINENEVKKVIVANDILEYFEIDQFQWLNNCTLEEEENQTFEIFKIVKKC